MRRTSAVNNSDSVGLLDAAASSLATLAFSDPVAVPLGVRLACLTAVEYLRAAGANPTRRPTCRDVHSEISEALALLGMLPRHVFARNEVLEAAAAARGALQAAG